MNEPGLDAILAPPAPPVRVSGPYTDPWPWVKPPEHLAPGRANVDYPPHIANMYANVMGLTALITVNVVEPAQGYIDYGHDETYGTRVPLDNTNPISLTCSLAFPDATLIHWRATVKALNPPNKFSMVSDDQTLQPVVQTRPAYVSLTATPTAGLVVTFTVVTDVPVSGSVQWGVDDFFAGGAVPFDGDATKKTTNTATVTAPDTTPIVWRANVVGDSPHDLWAASPTQPAVTPIA